jgi:hypothetical protein
VMIARWEAKLADAEADIKDLMGETAEPDA